jgi:hypothetical protein
LCPEPQKRTKKLGLIGLGLAHAST